MLPIVLIVREPPENKITSDRSTILSPPFILRLTDDTRDGERL